MTIRTRLLWLLLIVAMPLASLLVWLQMQSERAAVQAVYARLSSVANARASVTAQYFEDQQRVLARIAQRPGVRRLDPTQCDAIITEYPQLHPDFTNLTLRHPNGDLICSYLPNAVPKMTPQALQVFGFNASAAAQSVSNVFIGPTSGLQLVGTTKRVLAQQGDVHGYLLLGNDLLKTNPHMFAGVPADITVEIFDRNGSISFRSQDPEKWIGKPVATANRAIYSQKPDGQTVVTAVDGVRHMITWATIPGLGWVVTAGVSEAEAMGPYRQARNKALGFVALLLLAGVVLAYRVAQSINRPVRQLSDTAQRIGGGDLLVRATVSGPNELQTLATQFNAMLDANEETRAELRANEARWKFAIEGAGDGLWDWDVAKGTVFFSPRWKTMLGHTEDEIGSGLNEWSSRVHPDDMASVMEHLQPHLDGTIAQYTIEHRVLCKDGSYKWILDRGLVVARDADGKPLRVVGTHSDITERKRMTEALQHTQALLSSAEKLGRVGGWEIDVQTRQTTWTKGIYDIYELGDTNRLTVDEGVDYYTPESRPIIELAVQRAIEQGEPFDLELEIITAKGNRRSVLVMGKPDLSHGNVAGFFQDITERKRTEIDLVQSLRDKDALIKEVHHRVKNNLQVITSLLRLEAGRTLVADTKEVLGYMRGRIRTMAQLHESLYRSATFASVDLGVYLGQVATQAFKTQELHSDSVRLTLKLGSVQADIDQATAAGLLLNELISNCLKHGFPEGRTGEVSVELQPARDHDTPPDGRWCLRVSDTGVGRPPDFEDRRKASLGLQLVTDLSHQLGGTLVIDGEPGAGARFSVVFAVKAPAALVMPP